LEKTKNCAELLRRLKENCVGHKMALQNSSATFDPRKTPQLLEMNPQNNTRILA
jgi:hypothetical protein